jgi:membrane protease YdiL (CAAX protease family)
LNTVTTQRYRLAAEVIVIAAVFLVIRELLDGFKYASQVAEVACLVLITFMLRSRGSGWRAVGLRRPDHWGKALLLFVACVITIGVVFNFVIAPLFPQGANDINDGVAISRNEMLFQLIVIGIGTAAIGEELLFRGFLLNNLNRLLGEHWVATAAAIVLQAVVFGLLHSGVQGMVSAGTIGLILGFFYVLANRNLWVVIAAHAVPDMLSFISSFQDQA